MKSFVLVALIISSSPLLAKKYFIQIKNVKYSLEMIPEVHGIATDAFVNMNNMGKSEIMDTSVNQIKTNFEDFQSSTGETSLVVSDSIADEIFDENKFFACIKEVRDFLYVKKVRHTNTLEDTLAQSFLSKKRGQNNGLCSYHLGEKFNFIDDDSLLMLMQVQKALETSEFEKFVDMFLKSKQKTKNMNEHLAYEMIVSECAFDILLNKVKIIDLDVYKTRLISEVKASESLFQEKYANSIYRNVFIVNASTEDLVKTIRELK